jgi:hypothetical protein
MFRRLFACLIALSLVAAPLAVSAEEHEIGLAEGKITLEAPESWVKKTPKSRIIDFEFEVPSEEGDDTPGRMTIMGAGGTIDDNIVRWIGQFEQPDGSASKDKMKREETKIGGQKVYLVDISGTYKDQSGPFAPAVKREDYRMLAAIIATEKHGQYFVKFYGPKETVAKNEQNFKKMMESLKMK